MRRPVSVMIFAVLSILFGLIALVFLPCSIIGLVVPQPEGVNPVLDIINQSTFLRIWQFFAVGLGVIAAIVQIVFGIGLVLMKSWARLIAIAFSIYSIFMSLLGIIINLIFITLPLFRAASASGQPEFIGGVVGALIGTLVGAPIAIIYSIVMVIVMTRSGVIESFQNYHLRHDN